MKEETINWLEQYFEEHPRDKAKDAPVDHLEVDQRLTREFQVADQHYLDFVKRFGGASIGIYDIYGLRKGENMGNDFEGVVELTRHFRDQGWPECLNLLIFSFDQGGNPIGIAEDGRVWVIDADFNTSFCIAEDFEQFLRVCALEKEVREVEYLEIREWEK